MSIIINKKAKTEILKDEPIIRFAVDRKILVTGSKGFFGTKIVKFLKKKHQVTGIDIKWDRFIK